jgi:SpoVK/Ycf46/Vps4 family AAA+-type ATPase
LSTELRRRFTLGDFFFDLPDADEQAAIWPIHLKGFGLAADAYATSGIDTAGWTGAEIERACSLAYKLNRPLKDVAKYVVPISKSAAEEIESRRRRADRRFLSSSRPDVYEFQQQAQTIGGSKRAINITKGGGV